MKRWKVGFILGASYQILIYLILVVGGFYKGETWFSNFILNIYFATFVLRQFVSTGVVFLLSTPPLMLLSVLGISDGYESNKFIGIISATIGSLAFYSIVPLSVAFIGYLMDRRSLADDQSTEISRPESRTTLKKGILSFAVLIILFSLLLYPKPVRVIPKENTITVSSTPVFRFEVKPLISYPQNFITVSIYDANSGEYIKAGGGGGGVFGSYITPLFPIKDGKKIDVKVKLSKSFMKYVAFEVREFHYYFTVDANQHPSPEELEVINFLIDKGYAYGSHNRPSEEELETINKLKSLGVPPYGTRLKDVNWTD